MRLFRFALSAAALAFFSLAWAAGSSETRAAAGLRPLDPPAGPGAMAPELSQAADGGLLLTWLEPFSPAEKTGKKGHRLLFSHLTGGRWSAPSTIASGDSFFANWADFAAVAAEPKGGLVAHWLEKNGSGPYAYAVNLARSTDGGATWSRAGLLHDDGLPAEHGFVSWVREPAGLRAFWLDGRETVKDGAMTLRTARMAGKAEPGEVLDARVCDCCQTDAAMTSQGPIVAFRDRSDGEVRDIAVVRRTAAGWSRPALVHADEWQIPGCPVNGPAIAASGERVAVAWFTAAQSRPRVLLAVSDDAGARFGPPVEIDGNRPLGRVDVALDSNGDALVSWLALQEGKENAAAVQIRRIKRAAAKAGPPVVVAATSGARSSGFPRMVRSGDRLYLAWVEDGAGNVTRVRAASLPLSSVP